MSEVRLRMPAEHGAWGILGVPFVCAGVIAGEWSLVLMICAVGIISLFLLRGSIERGAREAEKQRARDANPEKVAGLLVWESLTAPVHVGLGLIAVVCFVTLLLVYGRLELLAIGAVGAALYAIQRMLTARHAGQDREKRSLAGELVGVGLLTLSAPAAWIASRGSLFGAEGSRIALAGAGVWLCNLLFFLGAILYVKYRVRAVLAHREFREWGERLRFVRPLVTYHAMVAALAIVWAVVGREVGGGEVPWLAGLAFLPGLARVGALPFQLGKRFAIPRLGWSEILHAAFFAVLLILAFRLSS